jgi:hypothetical protein
VVSEGLYFPYIKGPSSHLILRAREEYNKIQPFAPLPALRDWYLARQQMEYPPAVTGQSRPPKIRTAIPPPLFFFNAATPQKQTTYFYIWCCIRESIDHRWKIADCSQGEEMLRTHDQWREILSGEIFKKHASPAAPFDLRVFWLSDPGLIFKTGTEVRDLTSRLSDGTMLLPHMFQDCHPLGFTLKRMVCFDIALSHVEHQFERTDDKFVAEMGLDSSSERIKFRHKLRRNLFRDSVRLLDAAPPWESQSLVVKAGWYERLRFFVKDWQIHRPGYLQKDISIMNEPAFSREVQSLLVVYFEGVAHVLNTVPTMPWTFPSTHGVRNLLTL